MKKALIWTIPMMLLAACSGQNDPPPEATDASTEGSSACVAGLSPEKQNETVRSWIGGSLPADVDGPQECDFQDFAWQSFLALTAKDADGDYVFTTWGSSESLFPEEGAPEPYPGKSDSFSTHQITTKHSNRADTLEDPPIRDDAIDDAIDDTDVQQAASLVPLVDQRGRWVQYSVLTNEPEYEFVRRHGVYASDCYAAWGGSTSGAVIYDAGKKEVTVTCGASTTGDACPPSDLFPSPLPTLPAGSQELKASWRVLETCDLPDSPDPCTPDDPSTYLTVRSVARPYSPTVAEADVLLGLVGLHIISKTPDHKDWIWVTFEHEKNVPDCPGPDGDGDGGGDGGGDGDWTFYGKNENVNMFCTPCPVDLDQWTAKEAQTARDQAAKGQAVLSADGKKLLCSENPGAFNLATPPFYNPGTDEGQCAADPIPTQVCRQNPIQDSSQKLNDIVTGVLATDAPELSSYRLIGVLWLDSWCGANPDCKEQGETTLTNATMETYEQDINCLVCHGKNQFNPNPYDTKPYASGLADRSFIFHRIQAATLPDGIECKAPTPTYQCPECGTATSGP